MSIPEVRDRDAIERGKQVHPTCETIGLKPELWS
jgi:hypothetical protein